MDETLTISHITIVLQPNKSISADDLNVGMRGNYRIRFIVWLNNY